MAGEHLDALIGDSNNVYEMLPTIIIDLRIYNVTFDQKKGRSDWAMHARSRSLRPASRTTSLQSTSISSCFESGRPLAKVLFKWFQTPSSGFSSGA